MTEFQPDDLGPVEDDTPTPPTKKTRDQGERPPRRLLLMVVGVIAVALAITGSMAWWQAAHDPDIAKAEQRDAVLIQARQNIATLNTLDYRKVDAGLKAWTGATTGTLRDQLSAVNAADKKLLGEQGKISTGKVVDAAVVELDDKTATVIASVEVTVRDGKDSSAEPTVKRNRFSAELIKVSGRWKLESLAQVPVSL